MDYTSWNTSLGANGAALLSLPLLLASAITVGFVGAAARGSLEPNRFIGIRLPALLASPTAWRHGHYEALLPLATSSIVSLALASWAVWFPNPASLTVVILALAYAIMVAGAIYAIQSAEAGAQRVLAVSSGAPLATAVAL